MFGNDLGQKDKGKEYNELEDKETIHSLGEFLEDASRNGRSDKTTHFLEDIFESASQNDAAPLEEIFKSKATEGYKYIPTEILQKTIRQPIIGKYTQIAIESARKELLSRQFSSKTQNNYSNGIV
jgi:hypothetical protein